MLTSSTLLAATLGALRTTPLMATVAANAAQAADIEAQPMSLPAAAAARAASILDHYFSRSQPTAAMQIPPSQTGQSLPVTSGVALESLPPRIIEATVLGNTLLGTTGPSAAASNSTQMGGAAAPGNTPGGTTLPATALLGNTLPSNTAHGTATAGQAPAAQGRPIAQIAPELLARLQTPAQAGSDPLLAAGGRTASTGTTAPPALPPVGAQLYRVEIRSAGRTFHFVSPLPLPPQGTVRIDVRPDGLRLTGWQPAASVAPGALQPRGGPSSAQLAPPVAAVAASLREGVRQTLPLQQPLQLPFTRLQRLADSPQLPAALARPLRALLQSLPQPSALARPDTLRQALERSGTAIEARLATALLQPRQAASPVPADDIVAAVLADDRRAQLGAVLARLRPLLSAANGSAPAASNQPGELELTGPLQLDPATATKPAQESEPLDLPALQRLLLQAVARLQHHQLETVASRQPGPDGLPQPPTWLFELPVQTPRGIDHLQLRFEQHSAGSEQARRMQWQVRLDFDLHDLGRFSATLQASERGIAATLWSELEHTHALVRDGVAGLRARLAGSGVQVADVVCRHGLPGDAPSRAPTQLIDIHT